MDMHSSLLQKFVNYGQKKFYNIGPWPNLKLKTQPKELLGPIPLDILQPGSSLAQKY
jgi:hypothetical protein